MAGRLVAASGPVKERVMTPDQDTEARQLVRVSIWKYVDQVLDGGFDDTFVVSALKESIAEVEDVLQAARRGMMN